MLQCVHLFKIHIYLIHSSIHPYIHASLTVSLYWKGVSFDRAEAGEASAVQLQVVVVSGHPPIGGPRVSGQLRQEGGLVRFGPGLHAI